MSKTIRAAVGRRKISFRFFLILPVLIALIVPAAGYIASAQQADSPWYEVRSIDTAEYGLQNPAGFVFSPNSNAFLLWRENGNVTGIGMRKEEFDTQGLNIPVENARNVTFDPQANRLFAMNNGNSQLQEFGADENGLPIASAAAIRQYNIASLNITTASGITFDPNTGRLFILNARGNQLVIVESSTGSEFDGDDALREGRVTRVNLNPLRAARFQGIAFNPSNGHLYLLDPDNRRLYEITTSAQEVAVYDLSSLSLKNPRGLLFAPSGDITDDPFNMNLFILDGGQQAISDRPRTSKAQTTSSSGSIIELALVEPMALPPGAVLLPSTLVRTVDTSNAAWNPSSPDPAGITYWPLIGRLLVVDSEVEEMPPYWAGANVLMPRPQAHWFPLARLTLVLRAEKP
jgi:DNA-binding beta-propeller fold protein YncE